MGYIGIPNLPKVGEFTEENELAASHIKHAYCFYCPPEKRIFHSVGDKEFQFIFFGSSFYYHTYLNKDGSYVTIKTDPTQFIKYVNNTDNLLEYDFLNPSLYCNQGRVIEWAQNCIRNYEPK